MKYLLVAIIFCIYSNVHAAKYLKQGDLEYCVNVVGQANLNENEYFYVLYPAGYKNLGLLIAIEENSLLYEEQLVSMFNTFSYKNGVHKRINLKNISGDCRVVYQLSHSSKFTVEDKMKKFNIIIKRLLFSYRKILKERAKLISVEGCDKFSEHASNYIMEHALGEIDEFLYRNSMRLLSKCLHDRAPTESN